MFWPGNGLKTIDEQNKVIHHQKRHFGRFWQLIIIFLCIFKNTDQNNICASIIFKAKTKENMKNIFYGFYFKT